ncbi:hypothetical protein [Kyrpidia spormannii]|uniref:Uncharacterized protein n=2 Tax=Kyrpidia spormannii TaxID=2055160 RepID=A0ACA8Z5F5_9BACL|nr:hypothetical protein [Kyrpidia spormannii]CAB3389783.1 conserved protein of unknown function [Kyrpidia spormannii]CAB3390677.1 conserved protein of unknown function [Kyrpidia spormannii]
MTALLSMVHWAAWTVAALAVILLVFVLLGPCRLQAAGRVGTTSERSLSATWYWGVVRIRLRVGEPRRADGTPEPTNERSEPTSGGSGLGIEPLLPAMEESGSPTAQEAPPGSGPDARHPGPELELRIAGIPVAKRRAGPSRAGATRRGRKRRRARRDTRQKSAGGRTSGFDARDLPRLLRQMRDEEWIATAFTVLARLAKALHLEFQARGTYATPDPAWTGWIAALQGALEPVAGAATKERISLGIQPDFVNTVPDLTLRGQARFTPIAILGTALSLLARKDVRRLLRALRNLWRAPGRRDRTQQGGALTWLRKRLTPLSRIWKISSIRRRSSESPSPSATPRSSR